MKNDKNDKLNKAKRIAQIIGIVCFVIVMAAGTVIGCLYFLRPEFSSQENRMLEEFPEATAESVVEGEFFDGLSTWYADTYPFREELMSVDKAIEDAYGIRTTMVIGTTTKTADEIPDIEKALAEKEARKQAEQEAALKEEPAEETEAADDPIKESELETDTTEEPEEPAVTEENDEPEEPQTQEEIDRGILELEEAIREQIQDGLYVDGGKGYTRYYFSKNADRYIDLVSSVADKLEGQTTVYNILIPNSTPVSQDKVVDGLECSDEELAIAYYYAMMSDNVHTVDSFSTLFDHRDEYLYFRTDHHWTQLGAYYVYREFMKQKGYIPHDISYYDVIDQGEFLGTYYSTSKSKEMRKNPDNVISYVPRGTNDLTYYDKNKVAHKWNVVCDYSKKGIETKYWCYIGSDQPYAEIENPQITNGSSVILVKESFGNCFAPFLVDHYQHVYIVDYRYYYDDILKLVEEKKPNDLVILNNISIIGADKIMNWLIKGFDGE